MQIDFHHGVTYVVARLAGFGHREAETVAYCSQYVDDATNSGTLCFDNGAMFTRISSAHRMIDYRNFKKLANHLVWIPFHFLPGNGWKAAGENPGGTFITKIVCRPDSPVAREMIRACIESRHRPYGLHRLGITLHVYADTWAHQGFAGVRHEINNVTALDDRDRPDEGLYDRLKDFFGDLFDRGTGRFVSGALPLGHGGALSYPDRPYLRWNYIDGAGNHVTRDNPADFTTAADRMCRAMQRYRIGNAEAAAPGLPPADRDKIQAMLQEVTDEDGTRRHERWLEAIAGGFFGFPPVNLRYIPKGTGSWKHQAIGTRKKKDAPGDRHPYSPSFLGSDWKLFHDALLAHRFTVLHDILPRYGICAG